MTNIRGTRRAGRKKSIILPIVVVFLLLFLWHTTSSSNDVFSFSFVVVEPEDTTTPSERSADCENGSNIVQPASSSSSHDSSRNPVVRNTFAGFTDEELLPMIQLFTMVKAPHLNLAFRAIKRVNELGIEGDVVECGVWKGGVSMGMLIVNQRHNTDRHFWLFDTFEGLPEPTDTRNGKRAQRLFRQIQAKEEKNSTTPMIERLYRTKDIEEGKWNYGPLDVVQNNLYFSGYPKDKVHFVKGKVEDTLSDKTQKIPEKIAILRLDTDWYESTKIELEVLYDRLQPGGLLILDDYCNWPGARKATEEFFRDKLGIDTKPLSNTQPCFHYWKPK